MRNLAGRPDCDKYIAKELRKANIPIIGMDFSQHEVSASLAGSLRGFLFKRAWYYWTVRGNVPLHVAKKLYWHPLGKQVRVAGHCGCPHPNQWADRLLPNGGQVWPENQRKDWEAYIARHPRAVEHSNPNDIFSDDPTIGLRYVTSYHIDTQDGLNLFAKTLRKYNLVNK